MLWPGFELSAIFIKCVSQGCQTLLRNYNDLELQAALVIRGLFICEFAYSHFKIGQKWQFSSQKWTFYLQIQDLRSKMMGRIYRE